MFIPRFWSSIVITILTLPIQASIVLALSPPEISRIAKKSVVRIDGAKTGTGFIVSKNGTTYTVLTNAHVLNRSGNYRVLTPDNSSYSLVNRRLFPNNIDLAEAEFTSDRDYPLAELGSSQSLEAGSSIYSYGWNDTSTAIESRTPQLLTGAISSIRSDQTYKGYNLIYTLNRVPGMSGSPIYNDEGKVIGIYGLEDQQTTLTLGISIDTYKQRIKSNQDNLDLFTISNYQLPQTQSVNSQSINTPVFGSNVVQPPINFSEEQQAKLSKLTQSVIKKEFAIYTPAQKEQLRVAKQQGKTSSLSLTQEQQRQLKAIQIDAIRQRIDILTAEQK
jgi:Trypsin-like peptidase domain